MEDEDEDSDADDESYPACLVAVLEMQMWMRAVIISHSCEVKGHGRYAMFTLDDHSVYSSCDNQKIHILLSHIFFVFLP